MNLIWLDHRIEQMEAYRRDFKPLMDQINRNATALGWDEKRAILEIGIEWRRFLKLHDLEPKPKPC